MAIDPTSDSRDLQLLLDQVRLRREMIRSRMAMIETRRRELWERMDQRKAEMDLPPVQTAGSSQE